MLLKTSTKFQKLFNTKIYKMILLRCKELLSAWKTQKKDNNPSNNTGIRSDMAYIVQFFDKVICIIRFISWLVSKVYNRKWKI